MGAKVLFLGLKNGGNRVLFSNLASGGAAVAPPPPPGSPLPRSARAKPRPPKPPGARGGSSPPSEADSPLLTLRPLASARPAPTARPDRRSPRPARAPSAAGPGRADPGGPSPGKPRGSSAGRASARPRIPGGCKHGSQHYTTPSSLRRRRPHAHALLRERTPAGEELKVCFPPPHRLPQTAAGARGRQRVNPRALAPPLHARPPSPSEPASCALLRAGAGEPAARAPQVATITCKSSGGRERPTGVLLTAAGVRFLSSRWILLFMSMFPSSPLFKLNFPRRGRRGERRPGLRSEGRRKGSAGGRGRRCGPRHGRRAG